MVKNARASLPPIESVVHTILAEIIKRIEFQVQYGVQAGQYLGLGTMCSTALHIISLLRRNTRISPLNLATGREPTSLILSLPPRHRFVKNLLSLRTCHVL